MAELPGILVTREEEVSRAARELSQRSRVAFDLESNGLFAYRARICVVQLGATGNLFVVDALEAPLAGFAPLLSGAGPVKIVHDVAFDARMLAEAGLLLGNCHDTAVAARMLGKQATGLASLLASELGLTVDKSMQSHDWGKRPFDDEALAYLTEDVAHLEALDEVLWRAVEEAGIAREVDEETRYRLATANRAGQTPDVRPPFSRIKGLDRVPAKDLPILKRLADLRESEARRLDVPPYKVLSNDVLLAIASAKPSSREALRRIRGATQGPRAAALAEGLLLAVKQGVADGALSDEDRAAMTRPRVTPAEAKARRAREMRLMAWRREEAKARGVDEQVVLPGHCVKDLADEVPRDLEALANTEGLGVFRVEAYGPTMLALVAEPDGGA